MVPAEIKLSPVTSPALERLGITIEQLVLLARQGFIAAEYRSGRLVQRLHYRDASGRQRAVNIPAGEVSAIKNELDELQSVRRIKRLLAELNRSRRELDRDRKAVLAPLVAEQGLKFHGRRIRAPRWRASRDDC